MAGEIPEPVEIQGKPVEVKAKPRGGSPRAGKILEDIIQIVMKNRPPNISEAYLRGFVTEYRVQLLEILDDTLAKMPTALPERDLPPDEWTPKSRTEANLKAMELVAGCKELTKKERQLVGQYSGWGGLSIEAVEKEDRFPAGFPKPEIRGLIHEYYTPTKLALEIARVCQPLLANLPQIENQVLALEPAAGIGRMVRAFSGNGFRQVNWTVIEWSEISARMLGALRPDLDVYNGPFETWVTENGADVDGKLGLVVSNPPYGSRGAAFTEDPDRDYRERQAYAYFLRRGLDLLARWGLGVYLIPYGFMSGTAERNKSLREKVLKRHHLSVSYRLPSNLFPGALIVIDLVFFRGRGGELTAIPKEDEFILEGKYYETFPKNILGEEVGKQHDEDLTAAKPRWGYQVEGEFEKLPKLVERPIQADLVVRNYRSLAKELRRSGGVTRKIKKMAIAAEDLRTANDIGMRVDEYLAVVGTDARAASQLWLELLEALKGWPKVWGNPHKHKDLKDLAKKGVTGAERFLSTYTKAGKIIAGLTKKPVYKPRFIGTPNDVIGQAEFVYRETQSLDATKLHRFHRSVGGRRTKKSCVQALLNADWAFDGDKWDQLIPPDVYNTGWIWPRYKRAEKRWEEKGDQQAKRQLDKLKEALQIPVFDDLTTLDPRQGWIPLKLIERWMNENYDMQKYARQLELIYEGGLYQIKGVPYAKWMTGSGDKLKQYDIERETVNMLGYMNYDMPVFKPAHSRKHGPTLEQARFAKIKLWSEGFAAFLAGTTSNREAIETAYVKHFRGWVEPVYSSEPLEVARWGETITPHAHQVRGARRLLMNRGGLLAYDVGVGKTFTAILAIAHGRQEGFIRRPLIVVPNSLVWKWSADIWKCCPDYRIVVIGARKKLAFPRVKLPVKVSKPQKDLLSLIANGGVKLHPASARIIGQLQKLGLVDKDGRAKKATKTERDKLGKAARELLDELVKNELRAVSSTHWKALEAKKLIVKGKVTELGEDIAETLRGTITSVTDSPEERAHKWTQFQAGMYDVAIITYSSFPRTKMNLDALTEYADHTEAIKREIALMKRNAEKKEGKEGKKGPTERQKALLKEGTAAWVAEKTELPEKQRYDPGIDFDALGIDWVVVDEAQNFKNLYMPVAREGGAPKYMGSGASSKRAWNMDFRCHTIRERTGGTGICLLSATPAKNSPLEFYNILQYINHRVWEKSGIKNPEQFIDRYILLELQDVINTVTGVIEEDKSAVVGFKNLDELRDVIYRYGDFQTAADAGIKLPTVTPTPPIFIDMDEAQQEKYWRMRDEAESLKRQLHNPAARAKILGYLARMGMVAIHAELDEGYDMNTAQQADPHSPKIDECCRRVVANPDCGHIIFIENLAAQVWVQMVLLELGIDKKRIALMNAKVAKSSAKRQQIARMFNGGLNDEDLPDDSIEPALDVVIANQVAYEGIDLQRRTCEIHHLDLPWEPATLEQRNGRGVRQGNILGAIAINYYLSNKSMDVIRFKMIEGKHGWMKALLTSMDRDTMNPAAQLDIDAGELTAMLARDPVTALAEWKAAEETRQKKKNEKKKLAATALARRIASRFLKARWATDTSDAERLRREAERLLKELEGMADPELWPYVSLVYKARKHPMYVVTKGPPVWSGMKFGHKTYYDVKFGEMGKILGMTISSRHATSAIWNVQSLTELDKWKWSPDLVEPPDWTEDEELLWSKLERNLTQSYYDEWSNMRWQWASEAFLQKWWPKTEKLFRANWARVMPNKQWLPVVINKKLELLLSGGATRKTKIFVKNDWQDIPADTKYRILPPTEAGWLDFMKLSVPTKLAVSQLNAAAKYWWGRNFPRGYIAKQRKKIEQSA